MTARRAAMPLAINSCQKIAYKRQSQVALSFFKLFGILLQGLNAHDQTVVIAYIAQTLEPYTTYY